MTLFMDHDLEHALDQNLIGRIVEAGYRYACENLAVSRNLLRLDRLSKVITVIKGRVDQPPAPRLAS